MDTLELVERANVRGMETVAEMAASIGHEGALASKTPMDRAYARLDYVIDTLTRFYDVEDVVFNTLLAVKDDLDELGEAEARIRRNLSAIGDNIKAVFGTAHPDHCTGACDACAPKCSEFLSTVR